MTSASLASCSSGGDPLPAALARYERDRIGRYRQALAHADRLAETADPDQYATLFAEFVRWLLAPQPH